MTFYLYLNRFNNVAKLSTYFQQRAFLFIVLINSAFYFQSEYVDKHLGMLTFDHYLRRFKVKEWDISENGILDFQCTPCIVSLIEILCSSVVFSV